MVGWGERRGGRVAPSSLVAVAILAAVALAGGACLFSPGTRTASAPHTGVSALGDAGAYRFIAVDPVTGAPVRFDPCRPVPYVVNTRLAPPHALETVGDAFSALAEATGMEFRYEGPTDETVDLVLSPDSAVVTRPLVDAGRYGPDRYVPLLVTWQDFAGGAGSGPEGGEAVGGNRQATGGGATEIVSGSVVIAAGSGRARTRANLLHELGHVMGLDHVEDPFQLMTRVNHGEMRSRYGAGDLAGLRRIGRGAGCLPALSPSDSRPVDIPGG